MAAGCPRSMMRLRAEQWQAREAKIGLQFMLQVPLRLRCQTNALLWSTGSARRAGSGLLAASHWRQAETKRDARPCSAACPAALAAHKRTTQILTPTLSAPSFRRASPPLLLPASPDNACATAPGAFDACKRGCSVRGAGADPRAGLGGGGARRQGLQPRLWPGRGPYAAGSADGGCDCCMCVAGEAGRKGKERSMVLGGVRRGFGEARAYHWLPALCVSAARHTTR